jgi:hypothetical protein
MNQPNSAKLDQCLQLLAQFTAARSNQNSVFSEVAQAVQQIGNNLNQSKLKVKIFSQFPILSQAFYNFFAVSQPLPQLYDFNIVDLPYGFQPIQSNQSLDPTLTLEANQETGQPEYCQPLNPDKNILMGRDKQKLHQDYRSQNAIVLDLPNYQKVSSIHAEISLKPYSNPPTWQITDIDSKNGTYVNSKKINGTQILNSGDTITLAYDSASNKAPKFIFNAGSTVAGVKSSSIINDGELIFLITNPLQPFNDQERQLIHQSSQTKICGFIIISEFSVVNNEEVSQQVNANLSALNQWLKSNYPHLEKLTEVSPLVLQPFYTNPPSPIANPNLKEQYGKFCNMLIQLAKVKSDEITLDQTMQKIKMQINRIEQYYQKQTENLKSELQYSENKLQGQTIEEYQYQLKIKFRRVNEEREDFFEESRKKISDSKSDLINGFSQFSFITKISTAVEQLEPFVTKESGQVGIKLIKQGQNSHDYMIQLIKSQLGQWIETEWQQIINKLNYLIQDSYQTLNFIPSFSLANSFRSASQHPNSQKILQDSFVATQNNTSYSQSSMTNELISGGVQIATQGGFVVISALAGSPFAIMQGASLVSSVTRLVGGVLSRPQIEKNKLEEVITRLKQQNVQYYQRLAQFLADGLFKEMMNALKNEETYFKRSLNTIDDQFTVYFREFSAYHRQYGQRQQFAQQEMATFDQIKRLLT